jgi:integrase
MASDGVKARITKRLVDSAAANGGEETRIWDTDVTGFLLRVSAAGRKTYCLKYRVGGRQRWLTIGEHGSPWTPDAARERAREALYRASQGEDPQTEKIDSRTRSATVSELFDRYFVEGPKDKPLKRESSWSVDRYCYRRHILPLIGRRIARELAAAELAAWQADVAAGKTSLVEKTKKQGKAVVTGGSGAAARAMRCLSAMLSWAVRRELLDQNVASKVQKYRDAPRERCLNEEEAARLWAIVEEAERSWVLTRDFADIFRLIMLTGARRNEIVALRWSEIDLTRRRLVLPPTRTKMGGLDRPRIIVLSEPAAEILEARTPKGEFVFPSSAGDKPLVGVNRAWDKVRTVAGLTDVRLHDLRHTFATFAVEGGASLFMVGRTLGHSKTASTERYAHPTDRVSRQIAAGVAERFVRSSTET